MVNYLEGFVEKEAEKMLALEVWLGVFGAMGAVAQENFQINI